MNCVADLLWRSFYLGSFVERDFFIRILLKVYFDFAKNWEFFIEIDFFCVSKLSIDLFFKLPVSRFLAINIEGKIGQLTVRRTSSFIKYTGK